MKWWMPVFNQRLNSEYQCLRNDTTTTSNSIDALYVEETLNIGNHRKQLTSIYGNINVERMIGSNSVLYLDWPRVSRMNFFFKANHGRVGSSYLMGD